jgi:O-antigen/teichoic acid export membrane protein
MIDSTPVALSRPGVLRGLPAFRIARKGASAFAIKLANGGLALALQMSLARVLGHKGYGEYAYVLAWLQLMLIFAQGGFTTAALRYVAEYRACNQPNMMRGFVRRSSQIVLLQSIVTSTLLVVCGVVMNHFNSPGSVGDFLIASAALPFLAQVSLGSAVIRGLGHAIPGILVILIHPFLLLGGLLSAAYLFRNQLSSGEALFLHFAAAACALSIVRVMQLRLENKLDQTSPCVFRTGEWLGTATQMMFTAGLIYLQGRTGVIITGLLLDARAAGTYAAMERLADTALMGLVCVNMLAAPSFAALHAGKRRHELQRYARWTAWGASAFMLTTVVPLVLFGEPILNCFGGEFTSGYPALLIMLGGVAVNALCGSCGTLLNMTGHHRETLGVAFSSLCLSLILSLALVPRYGIVGTAISFAVSMAWCNIWLMLIVRRRLGIWSCVGHIT